MPEPEPDTDLRAKFMLQNWNTLYMGYFSLILLPFRRMFHIIISFSSDRLRLKLFQIFNGWYCHHLRFQSEMISRGCIEAVSFWLQRNTYFPEKGWIDDDSPLWTLQKSFLLWNHLLPIYERAISIPIKTINEEQQVLNASASPLNSRQTNCGDRECHLGESEIHFL